MTGLSGNKSRGIIALLAVFALAGLAAWLGARTTPGARNHPFDDYPELFVHEAVCPDSGDAFDNGRRSEEHAHLRADRYVYDPRDGVRAVQQLQEAESCYRAAGDELGAHRVRRAISGLTTRVNTDYAAARLNLSNALEQERWSAALSEIRRLLLLTDHIGRHEYVEWLTKIIGSVAAKASTES